MVGEMSAAMTASNVDERSLLEGGDGAAVMEGTAVDAVIRDVVQEEDEGVNGLADGNSEPTPQMQGVQSSSSKFASLRAAFEQGASAEKGFVSVKKRVPSAGLSERQPDREHEAEVSRLKTELENERQLRTRQEENHEAEILGLREQLEKEKKLQVENEERREREVSLTNEELEREKKLRTEIEEDSRAELSRLKEELEKEKELRVEYEEKLTALDEEIEGLHAQMEERERFWQDEYDGRGERMKREAEERLSVVHSEANSRKQEVSNLQKQLSDLKRSVSTSTRVVTQVSDSEIKQDVGGLNYEIQNWIVNNFRRVQVDASSDQLCRTLEQVTEPQQCELLQPIYQRFDASVKVPILQATVACFFMEIFDDPYLFGLFGKQDWSKRVKQAADTLPAVLNPVAYSKWRAATFDAIRKTGVMQELVDSAARAVSELTCMTLTALTDVEESETRFSSLSLIAKRAVNLAHLMRVQQAQYMLHLPCAGEAFDADTMDDPADNNSDDPRRVVRLATSPSIIKLSHEPGDQSEFRNVLVRAKVVCVTPDP